MTEALGIREARLKVEFAHLYPMVPRGEWVSASDLMARVVSWMLDNGRARYRLSDRILPDEHFEFRGETARTEPGPQYRSRRGDADRSTWPDGPFKLNNVPDSRLQSINVIRGMALACGADSTRVLDPPLGDRYVMLMSCGNHAASASFAGEELDRLTTDESVDTLLYTRICHALKQRSPSL